VEREASRPEAQVASVERAARMTRCSARSRGSGRVVAEGARDLVLACGHVSDKGDVDQPSALRSSSARLPASRGAIAADAVEVDPAFHTGVRGLSAAGDASTHVPSPATAVAAGSSAARIVHGLMAEAHGLTPVGAASESTPSSKASPAISGAEPTQAVTAAPGELEASGVSMGLDLRTPPGRGPRCRAGAGSTDPWKLGGRCGTRSASVGRPRCDCRSRSSPPVRRRRRCRDSRR
jgi:hypothetical protein